MAAALDEEIEMHLACHDQMLDWQACHRQKFFGAAKLHERHDEAGLSERITWLIVEGDLAQSIGCDPEK